MKLFTVLSFWPASALCLILEAKALQHGAGPSNFIQVGNSWANLPQPHAQALTWPLKEIEREKERLARRRALHPKMGVDPKKNGDTEK